eukprot:GHUV01011267.1.p2 GENE.GHUV01011267.1~~GHUV01011267.1.p2  ORF type:complete len:126 (+),score=22.41 GHUV01011267.1:756-1133(+)
MVVQQWSVYCHTPYITRLPHTFDPCVSGLQTTVNTVMIRSCRWVDEVVKDAPWVITKEFLDQHNIDYVAHDDLPYADNSGQADDIYGPVSHPSSWQQMAHRHTPSQQNARHHRRMLSSRWLQQAE